MSDFFDEEIKFLDICLKEIEKKLKWGSREQWTNHNFTQLSLLIAEASDTSLSISSIRRIFGQDKSYKEKFNPQLETKNALVKFLGFENWADFKIKKSKQTLLFHFIKKTINKKIKFYFILIIFIILLIIFSIILINTKKIPVFSFTGKNLIGTTPHTVIINYDISKIKDSCFIHFGEEKSKWIYLQPKNNIITYSYGIPFYYTIQLKSKDKILAKLPCIIKTEWWKRRIRFSDFRTSFDLLNKDSLNGRLFTSNKIIDKQAVSMLSKKEFYVEYRYINALEINGDNFNYETIVKNPENEGGISCFNICFKLIGTKQKIEYHLTDLGCARWVSFKVAENEINGSNNDLKNLTLDLKEWRKINLLNNNKNIQLFFDDKKIFETSYKNEIGNIIGIIIEFRGSGSVEYLKIEDNKNKKTYIENFEK